MRIRMILTDNGKEFTDRLFGLRKRAATGTHEFDKLCTALNIKHRLTPPKSPQTNGMVERFNGRVEEVLQSHHFRSGEELETTLHRYVWLYNQKLPQSALGSKTPLQAMKKWHKLKPEMFKKRPYFLPGYDTYVMNNPLKFIDPLGLDGCGPNPNECVVTGTKKKKPSWPIYIVSRPTIIIRQPNLVFGGGGGGNPPQQCSSGGGPRSTNPVNTWPTPGNSNLTQRDTSRGQGGGAFGDARSGGRTHRGIDIAAPAGSNVVAAGSGNVVLVNSSSSGTAVEMYHSGGYVTRYYHLGSRTVTQGQRVIAGQTIGTVGRTGNVPANADTHLHFETILYNTPVDPANVVNPQNTCNP